MCSCDRRMGRLRVQVLVTDRVQGKQLYMPMNSMEEPVNKLTGSTYGPCDAYAGVQGDGGGDDVLPEQGENPLPRENFRNGKRTPQAGVEVERKWARADYSVPGTRAADKLVQIKSTEGIAMANPLVFEPKKVDPQRELQRRLEAAPREHAEALLVAFDILEEAHRQGLLDMVHGAVGSRDAILGKLAAYAREPVSIDALRNLLALGQMLGSVNPDVLAGALKDAGETMQKRRKAPPRFGDREAAVQRRRTARFGHGGVAAGGAGAGGAEA